ncbi:hypothetical protein PC120_g24983 [Phytophthora cactorum]|nr:hypothetical protein PC120_g24983 [Phytophthora cactorum]
MARRGRRSGVNQLLERGNAITKLHDQRSKFHLDVRRSLSGLRDVGLLIRRLHDRAERESHGQPGVDRTRGIVPPPPPPLRDARGSTRWIVERIGGYEPPKPNRDQTRLVGEDFLPHRDTWEPRNVLVEVVREMVRADEAQDGVRA